MYMKTLLPAIFFSILLFSCGRKVAFLPSTMVPAATGVVKVNEDQNNNYAIRLNVTNLAAPGRLSPAKDSYVVWVETEENRAQNMGRLRSKKGLFSKAWKGELETISTAKPVRVFITAEDNVNPQYPGEIVLNTRLFNVK
jgi:hypothetical protein